MQTYFLIFISNSLNSKPKPNLYWDMESKKGKNALQFLCSKDLVNIRVCISMPSLFEQRAGQGPDQSVTTS